MAAAAVDAVREYPDADWGGAGPTRAVEAVVESGRVLSFPHLAFAFGDEERRFLDPKWADSKAKNVSVSGLPACFEAPPAKPPIWWR